MQPPTKGSVMSRRKVYHVKWRTSPKTKAGRTALLREFHTAGFAHDRHANLSGILQVFLDLTRDAARQRKRLFVVELLGLDKYAQLAARLDGETLFHAREGSPNPLQILHTLEVSGHRF